MDEVRRMGCCGVEANVRRPNHRHCVIANAYMLCTETNAAANLEDVGLQFDGIVERRLRVLSAEWIAAIAGKTCGSMAHPCTPRSQTVLQHRDKQVVTTVSLIIASTLLYNSMTLPSKCTIDACYPP